MNHPNLDLISKKGAIRGEDNVTRKLVTRGLRDGGLPKCGRWWTRRRLTGNPGCLPIPPRAGGKKNLSRRGLATTRWSRRYRVCYAGGRTASNEQICRIGVSFFDRKSETRCLATSDEMIPQELQRSRERAEELVWSHENGKRFAVRGIL